MKKTVILAVTSLALTGIPARAEVDCHAVSISLKRAIVADKERLLEIVSTQVAASPQCACEIVKSSIEASHADTKTVAAIVETASIAAPEQMRLIAQCAVAMAPDALADVQAVMAKLDPNLGEGGRSAKDSKAVIDAKDAKGGASAAQSDPSNVLNPLNFPGQGPVGPIPGGPGGATLFPQLPPQIPMLLIAPPEVSNVNP